MRTLLAVEDVSLPSLALTSTEVLPRRLAYTIEELAAATSISRSQLYLEIDAGRLVRTFVGRRAIVTHSDALAWLARLPRDDSGDRGGA